ncbi:MAG: hypothetical protein C5B47_02535 [Verrucomicrobia bacterium]|nr:MAG: hypothetical protein C5B47_02535 [Verrucomicrobiota bacterium]
MIVAALCLLAAIASPYFTVIAMKQQEKVVVIDPSGTIVYSPLLAFSEAGELCAYQAKLACMALLQRNPAGPDNPDLLQKLYVKEARVQTEELIKSQSQYFTDKQIHQKVELSNIDVLATRKLKAKGGSYDSWIVRARGNLIRLGTFEGLPIEEPHTFSLDIEFIRNPDIAGNGLFPLLVTNIAYEEKAL